MSDFNLSKLRSPLQKNSSDDGGAITGQAPNLFPPSSLRDPPFHSAAHLTPASIWPASHPGQGNVRASLYRASRKYSTILETGKGSPCPGLRALEGRIQQTTRTSSRTHGHSCCQESHSMTHTLEHLLCSTQVRSSRNISHLLPYVLKTKGDSAPPTRHTDCTLPTSRDQCCWQCGEHLGQREDRWAWENLLLNAKHNIVLQNEVQKLRSDEQPFSCFWSYSCFHNLVPY